MEIASEKQLSLFRRYYLEVSILVLATALAFTVKFVINLNNSFFLYVLNDKTELIQSLNNNSRVIQMNSDVINDVKSVLIQNKNVTNFKTK